MTDNLDDLACFPGKWVLPEVAEARKSILDYCREGERVQRKDLGESTREGEKASKLSTGPVVS